MYTRSLDVDDEDEPYTGKIMEIGFSKEEIENVDYLKILIDNEVAFIARPKSALKESQNEHESNSASSAT